MPIPTFQPKDRYLSLLRGALSRSIWDSYIDEIPMNSKTPLKKLQSLSVLASNKVLGRIGFRLGSVRRRPGSTGETMIGKYALEHLQACAETVLAAGVPGDFCEAGVWRGGACILMQAVLTVHAADKKIWLLDSFEGLPKPSSRFAHDAGDTLWKDSLAVSVDQVKANFERYGLLGDNLVFVKGFFENTVPTLTVDKLSLLRLDGDMYGSTWTVLEGLYDRVQPGGYVIVDDYGVVPACAAAIHDFRKARGIGEQLFAIGLVKGTPVGAFWRKGTDSPGVEGAPIKSS